SVTVSIAALTIGISSAIVRVSLVAVRTSFGSTDDSAGTSRTSSKVRPSRPNFSSYESSCPSKADSVTACPDGLADGSELDDLDPGEQAAGLAGVEATCSDLERGRRSCGDAEPQ